MSKETVLLVASGDLRQSANEKCWPAQATMEKRLAAALRRHGTLDFGRPPRRMVERWLGFVDHSALRGGGVAGAAKNVFSFFSWTQF